jgi:hypothetical protein
MLIYNTEIFLRVCSKFSLLRTYFLVGTVHCQSGKVFTIFTSLMEGKERKGKEGRKTGKAGRKKRRKKDGKAGRKEGRKDERKEE